METIYLVAVVVSIVLGIINFLHLKLALVIGILLTFGIFMFQQKKDFFLLILPILFLIRVATTVYFGSIDVGNKGLFQVNIVKNRGFIEKIDNKFLTDKSYVNIENKSEGRYRIYGVIENREIKKGKSYYKIKILGENKMPIGKLREYFKNKAETLVKKGSYSLKALYSAVILGESSKLSKELRERFSYIGISHIIALSGFHVGVIILIFNFLLLKTKLNRKQRNILLIVLLSLYYCGVEPSQSLQRAYIMGILVLLGNVFYENVDILKSLVFSYVVSLIINPMSFKSVSFRLSYLAVFIIATIYPLVKKKINKKSKIVDMIALTLVIQILLTPLLINEFGTFQLFSFISNIVIIPIGTVFILFSFLGLLFENVGLGFLLFPFINYSFKVFMWSTEIFAKIPYMSVKYTGDRHNIVFALFYVVLIGILYLKWKKGRESERIHKRDKISQ